MRHEPAVTFETRDTRTACAEASRLLRQMGLSVDELDELAALRPEQARAYRRVKTLLFLTAQD